MSNSTPAVMRSSFPGPEREFSEIGLSDDEKRNNQEDGKGDWKNNPTIKDLIYKEGLPYSEGDKNRISLNQAFFPALFMLQNHCLYDPSEDAFYIYNELNGLWIKQTSAHIKSMFSDDFAELFREILDTAKYQKVVEKRTDSFLNGCLNLLKGKAEKRDVFGIAKSKRVIHVIDSVIDLSNPGVVESKSFSPDWYSRNQIPLKYNRAAKCSRFLDELLRPHLDEDDILLLQKYCGNVILGGNRIQQLLILYGMAGGGKGTVSEIIEGVLGRTNCAELRTNHLTERFELNSYVGKLLLCGKDVDGDFLEKPGASVIKKLVGHDWVDAEHKFSNERTPIRGELSIIINCNSRLRVRIDGDADAWRRRLLLIEYKKTVTSKVIPNFSKILLEEEGSGILAWMIEGAIKLIQDVEAFGAIALSDAQRDRVDCLLQESDGLRQFIVSHVTAGKGTLTTEEIIAGYVSMCKEKGWKHLSIRLLENQIPDIILREFTVQKSYDIKRDSEIKGAATNHRGYKNLIFKEANCENQKGL